MVRRQTPIRPPNRVFKHAIIHPSECRSFPYPQEVRDIAIRNRIEGIDGPDNHHIQELRNLRLYPSSQTVCRWVQRFAQHGHSRAFKRTGNRRAQREIKNRELVLLSFYRAALPKSSIAEVNAFLFNMNAHLPDNRLFSYSQICRAEASILISKKRSSTTAVQAMDPINIQRRHNFWNLPYPYGSLGIDPRDMIDLDEAGIYPNQTNRKYGKGVVGGRVRECGLYAREAKLNILMAVAGDENGDRWYDFWEEGGTTNERFLEFLERIIEDVGHGNNERRRCFIMDNLNVHRSPTVFALIVGAGHRVLYRAPYYPIDGPIEYVFNTIQNLLCIFMREITDVESLRNNLIQIIGSIENFINYFAHVGFEY